VSEAERMAGRVGPVLEASPTAQAVLDAILAEHPDALVLDRGSYWRVLVPGRCRVTRRAIEGRLGHAFELPGELERVMPSFKGRLVITGDEATWTLGADGPA
jgi:hypothetical protein